MHASTAVRTVSALTISALLGFAACEDETPLEPDTELAEAIDELRYVTARYHDLDNAIEDGFVFVHGCEERPGEGQVGAVYVHPDRMPLGIDPSLPQGLLYEIDEAGDASLLGAELVVPFDNWTESEPPEFLGYEFQPEDEFDVYGLHVWIWRENPDGMFAQAHPGVSCAAE